MTNAILVFFALSFLLQRWIQPRARAVWIAVSVVALAQMSQPTLLAAIVLLGFQELVIRFQSRVPVTRFLPLIYASTLIALHHIFHWNITGFSYLVLASSLDVWWGLNGEKTGFRDRLTGLLSFPKTLVGPIAAGKDHRPVQIAPEKIARLALIGILKGFVLVNIWRAYVPAPVWGELGTVLDYFWFGLWQYVHLYLEFSGICDLVAAAFWLYGFGCPLNFDRPYLAVTITDFWKRWHITLSLWIKNFVFIPLGGSRVSRPRIYINLLAAMLISGAWHGVTPNFLGWGLLQGVFLCVERAIGLESRMANAGKSVRVVSWAITQLLVTASWILFFAKI